jgi:hypothetical protein
MCTFEPKSGVPDEPGCDDAALEDGADEVAVLARAGAALVTPHVTRSAEAMSAIPARAHLPRRYPLVETSLKLFDDVTVIPRRR